VDFYYIIGDCLITLSVIYYTIGDNVINVKKNCSLSTTYNGEMTHRKQQK